MNPQTENLLWLDARETVTLAELARASGMEAAELDALIDYGALTPITPITPLTPPDALQADSRFSAECVVPLRKAGRLRRDFELDLFAVALLMDSLNRIEVLERRIRTLQARSP